MRRLWILALLFTPLPLISGLGAGNLPASQVKLVVQPKQDQAKKGNLYYVALGQEASWYVLPAGFERAMKSAGKEMYREIHGKILFNRDCTKAKILEAVDWMVENAKEGDLVMFFIGCHGSCSNPASGESIFHTTDKKQIKPVEIKSKLAKLPCEAIVINDACQSGNWGKERPGDPMPPNVTALCCCLPTEFSAIQFDIVVFEGLHGKADYNKDGIVDLDELITYSATRIKEVGQGPLGIGGLLHPVLTKSKNLTDSKRRLPLTKANPNLISVVPNNKEVFAAIVEEQDGDNYKVHVIGFGPKGSGLGAGNTPTQYTRAKVILPSDGAPVMAKGEQGWRPGYTVGKQGETYKVRFIGSEGAVDVPAADIYHLFAANPTAQIPQGLPFPVAKKGKKG